MLAPDAAGSDGGDRGPQQAVVVAGRPRRAGGGQPLACPVRAHPDDLAPPRVGDPHPVPGRQGRRPRAGGDRREHAAVVGAEPEDHVVGDDRDPHRVPVHREIGDRAVQRRDGRDAVRHRVDPDDPAVLGARHPDVAAGEDHGRRGQRGREALLDRSAPGGDAHRLGRAGHPDGARSEGDARGTPGPWSPLAGMENRRAIAPVVPSSRTSPSPPSSVTQAPPPPVAMPPGMNGSFVVERTLRDAMSTRATRRSSPRSTQASPAPNATSQGWLAKGMPPTTSCERTSISPSDFGGISSRAGAASPPPRRTTTPTRTAAATTTAPASAQRARRRPAGARRGGASPRSAAALGRRRARRSSRTGRRAPSPWPSRRRRRTPRAPPAGPRWRAGALRSCGRRRPRARSRGERRLAGEALEEHAAQGVDVGPRVDRPPPRSARGRCRRSCRRGSGRR